MDPVETVRVFWETMNTNDFRAVGELLADDFVLEWPQSQERIVGRERFAQMNEEYPAAGRWSFVVNDLFGNDERAVSDVSVSDGVVQTRAISFFTVMYSRIVRMVEYWPEDYPASANRVQLAERMGPGLSATDEPEDGDLR